MNNMFNKGKDLEQQFSEVASLIGDRSRALILWSLLDGKAYTATELSISAGLSAQGASNHLARLVNAGLLSVDKQGRHRYYRYANDSVAKVIESMASLFPPSS
ncbi:MAG TPA: helix-turn-helix transcriptional regulator, partial [Chitinophagaceae bacterium]